MSHSHALIAAARQADIGCRPILQQPDVAISALAAVTAQHIHLAFVAYNLADFSYIYMFAMARSISVRRLDWIDLI
jgi:hypothetical protein